MIATDIAGNPISDGNQILDLINLVASADPQVYSKKLKEIQDATEKHRKTIELLAPASEIEPLRNSLRAELADAKAAKNAAKDEADKIVAAANTKAAEIVSAAQAEADAMKQEAARIQAAAQSKLDDAKAAEGAALSAEAEAKKATAHAKSQATISQKEAQAAREAQAAADALKADLTAKAKAFIESL